MALPIAITGILDRSILENFFLQKVPITHSSEIGRRRIANIEILF
jgi:hypothetical protein